MVEFWDKNSQHTSKAWEICRITSSILKVHQQGNTKHSTSRNKLPNVKISPSIIETWQQRGICGKIRSHIRGDVISGSSCFSFRWNSGTKVSKKPPRGYHYLHHHNPVVLYALNGFNLMHVFFLQVFEYLSKSSNQLSTKNLGTLGS